jgi:hypothetical protein
MRTFPEEEVETVQTDILNQELLQEQRGHFL